jgi:hypothetical protein
MSGISPATHRVRLLRYSEACWPHPEKGFQQSNCLAGNLLSASIPCVATALRHGQKTKCLLSLPPLNKCLKDKSHDLNKLLSGILRSANLLLTSFNFQLTAMRYRCLYMKM